MSYEEALHQVLPADLPDRPTVVRKTAQHLHLIEEANRQFNLTRITGPRDAAIKHVLDSIIPWQLFAGAAHVLDAGTGAGFPGVPLALVLPATRFTLVESTQKKARFVASAVAALELANVEVSPVRAEDFLRHGRPEIVTARAVTQIVNALALFGPVLKSGTKALLYKGPDVEQEIADAAAAARKHRAVVRVVMRYELPESQGRRTIVEIAGA